jgi:elongin-C
MDLQQHRREEFVQELRTKYWRRMSEEEVQYVKLISSEGHEFILDRSIAVAYSKTIAMMLEGSFLEAQENVIRFPEMAGFILERLVKYLHYKAQYSNSSSRIPDFVSANNTVGLNAAAQSQLEGGRMCRVPTR